MIRALAFGLLALVAFSALVTSALLVHWTLRSPLPTPGVPPGVETWTVVPGSEHNAFVDLLAWRGELLLVHVAAPSHMGTPRSRVVVRRSSDGRRFEPIAELQLPGRDIRDPKLAAIGGRLCLYVLANDDFLALPRETLVATSHDGARWSSFERVGPPGFLLWRPRTPDGRRWYVPAFGPGASVLLRSEDGIAWSEVSTIHAGEDASETELAFLPGGRALAIVRLEASGALVLGSERNGTLLATADPPYEVWNARTSRATRLDGPALFSAAGRSFAVGRRQPGDPGRFTKPGGLLSRKRTALYEVDLEELELVHLGDLPSAGDTSYAGGVSRPKELLIVYYTSDPRRDPPWLLGMWMPTEIRIARVPIPALLEAADAVSPERRAAAARR